MLSSIYFFSEDIKFRPPGSKRTSSWLKEVAKSEATEIGELTYVFCSDLFLLDMNIKYLGHDTLTDIITFDVSESQRVEGEIYISIERVKENSRKYRVSFNSELHRVMVHGLLHLLGYGDKTASEKKIMRKKELAYLSLTPF